MVPMRVATDPKPSTEIIAHETRHDMEYHIIFLQNLYLQSPNMCENDGSVGRVCLSGPRQTTVLSNTTGVLDLHKRIVVQ